MGRGRERKREEERERERGREGERDDKKGSRQKKEVSFLVSSSPFLYKKYSLWLSKAKVEGSN